MKKVTNINLIGNRTLYAIEPSESSPLENQKGTIMEKLTTNGTTYFVRNTKKVVDSLFTGGATAAGTFKVLKNRVMFYDLQGELFAALIVNRHGDAPFFVNAFTYAGKSHYQYATGEAAERNLGITGLGYRDMHDVAANVARKAGLVREAA